MVFIFDENYSWRLADALHLLEQGNKSRVKIVAEICHVKKAGEELGIEFENGSKSYTDEQVIEIAGKKKGIIITQDADFKKLKLKAPLYKKHNVGVIFFKTYQDSVGYWNLVTYVINNWSEIKDIAEKETPPFFYFIDKKKCKKIEF